MKSGNPTLKEDTFQGFDRSGDPMTINGCVNKTGLLLLMTFLTASYVWSKFFESQVPSVIMPYLWTGCIGGLVVALIIIFKQTTAPYLSPVYALLEGSAIGGLSAIFEARYPGIVVQAVGLTFGTFLCLLLAYKSGLIKATENFKLGVIAATGGIAVLYLVNLGLQFFFSYSIPFIHEGGTWGIIFSLFVVCIAALNLVLDFDFIEQGVSAGAPKYMEWYAAFGLLVTLIWLYLEILRLLGKAKK